MALATGTILYVIFFEILPKAKEIGATGFQQVSAMVVGFGVFLPTLLLRKLHIADYCAVRLQRLQGPQM